MLLALLLTYAGFTALCLSMPRHHAELLGAKPSTGRQRAMSLAGWLLLVLSLWAAVAANGWSAVAAVSPASGLGTGRVEPVGESGCGMGAVLKC
jgi:hypothetical protein